MSPLERAVAFLRGNLIETQTANTGGTTVPRDLTTLAARRFGSSQHNLMAALVFFHATDGGCKAPILFLTTTP